MDVFGEAVFDYQLGLYTEDLITFSSIAGKDVMPVPYLFRDFAEMPKLEQKALELSKGNILDIGCGAGSHSFYLQENGFNVTALDSSKGAIETCRLRGIKNCVNSDIMSFNSDTFDTLLLLMNGIGIAGSIENLNTFLSHLKRLLKPNGQILVDSSDIIYMFDKNEDTRIPKMENYYGEVNFTMSYKNKKSNPFSWLYLDQNMLKKAAKANQFNCEIVSFGEHFDYLARLSLL